jgi:hypothetical protein
MATLMILAHLLFSQANVTVSTQAEVSKDSKGNIPTFILEIAPKSTFSFGKSKYRYGVQMADDYSIRTFYHIKKGHYIGLGFEKTSISNQFIKFPPSVVSSDAYSVIGYRFAYKFMFIDFSPTMVKLYKDEDQNDPDNEIDESWEFGLKTRVGLAWNIKKFRIGIAVEYNHSLKTSIFSTQTFVGYTF